MCGHTPTSFLLFIISGGYERFSAEYPFLRTQKILYTPTVSDFQLVACSLSTNVSYRNWSAFHIIQVKSSLSFSILGMRDMPSVQPQTMMLRSMFTSMPHTNWTHCTREPFQNSEWKLVMTQLPIYSPNLVILLIFLVGVITCKIVV